MWALNPLKLVQKGSAVRKVLVKSLKDNWKWWTTQGCDAMSSLGLWYDKQLRMWCKEGFKDVGSEHLKIGWKRAYDMQTLGQTTKGWPK